MCRLDNNDCIVTNCQDNCCNSYGNCPSDYDSSLYDWPYSSCWYYYSCERNNNASGPSGLTLGLAIGGTLGCFFIFIVTCCVCLYIKNRKKKPGQADITIFGGQDV